MENVKSLKVFIVDDDPFCRLMYQQHLKNLGFKDSHIFSNGDECMEHVIQEQPDIVFLDYDMKPINGLDMLKKIQSYNPAIRLLLLSSQKDIRVVISALKNGAYDYIPKGKNDLELISKAMGNILVATMHASEVA